VPEAELEARFGVLDHRPGVHPESVDDLEQEANLARLHRLGQHRLDPLAVIVPGQLLEDLEPDRPRRHLLDSLDHRPLPTSPGTRTGPG
jgi:hypothetical protein